MCGVDPTQGMISLQNLITQNLWILLSAIALFFYVGLVLNVAEIQFSSSIGYQIGQSHAIEQAVGMIILLGLAAAAKEMGPDIQELICDAIAGGGGTEDTMVELWRGIAHLVVTITVSGVTIWLAISAVYSGLSMQIAHIQGVPRSVSESLVKLITILIGGVLTILSAWGANYLLELIFTK